MKAKMRFNEANGFALLHMIGQSEDMGMEGDVAMIASYAGVSKNAVMPRLWKLLEVGYLECNVGEHRPNCERYVFSLTVYGREIYEEGRFRNYYKQWVSVKEHVAQIRIGSQKSIFV